MKKKIDTTKQVAIFEEKEVRRTWYNEQWFFVIEDVVHALIDSGDVKQYIQRIKQRDPGLGQGWVQIVHCFRYRHMAV